MAGVESAGWASACAGVGEARVDGRRDEADRVLGWWVCRRPKSAGVGAAPGGVDRRQRRGRVWTSKMEKFEDGEEEAEEFLGSLKMEKNAQTSKTPGTSPPFENFFLTQKHSI